MRKKGGKTERENAPHYKRGGAACLLLGFAAFIALAVGVSYRVPPVRFAESGATVKFCVPGDVPAVAGAEAVKNGADTIICCRGENAAEVLKQLPAVTAMTVAFPGNEAKLYEYVNRLGLTVTRVERAEGVLSVYGFSPHVAEDPVKLYGEKVNVQLALSAGLVSVGFPLLMTDF